MNASCQLASFGSQGHQGFLTEQDLPAFVIERESEMGMGQPTSRAQEGQLLDASLRALLASLSLVLSQL